MKISQELQNTLSDSGRFLTLSLSITMFEKCVDIFARYGLSTETLGHMYEGMQSISQELEEGYKFVKNKEEFNDLVRPLKPAELSKRQ